MRKILFALLAIVLISSIVYAQNHNITFVWDKNSEPDLAGYKLYQRDQTSDFYKVADIMSDSNRYMLDTNISTVNYWVITAYDESGNESDFSNEVSFTPDNISPGPPQGLRIESISVVIDFE